MKASPASNNTSWGALVLSFGCGVGVSLCSYALFRHFKRLATHVESEAAIDYNVGLQKLIKWRQEERTGRIRAEVKLRTVSKALEQLRLSQQLQHQPLEQRRSNESEVCSETLEPSATQQPHTMLLQCIGTVASPYTKRMGTPRQPQLVPDSVGFIEFTCPAAALDGIDQYSHVWIVFQFHANTNIVVEGGDETKKKQKQAKTKIRPPRAGGQKVGQLATRSPHRPNALGLSLVRIQSFDNQKRRLYLSGLDLVHGTPVYDVKPCVPWDIPTYVGRPEVAALFQGHKSNNNKRKSSLGETVQNRDTSFYVPGWVQQDDALAEVIFSTQAAEGLRSVVQQGCLAPFYTHPNKGTNDNNTESAKAALSQILSQDPRSSHKGLKTNARGTYLNNANKTNKDNNNNTGGTTEMDVAADKDTISSKEHLYSVAFGQCRVYFSVPSPHLVQVVDVVPFDTSDLPHVDGVPLVSLSMEEDVPNAARKREGQDWSPGT